MKFKQEEKRESLSGDYLKLKDGESITGCFRGEIFEFFVKWENGKSTRLDGWQSGASKRYLVNFVTKGEDGKLVAKTWDLNKTSYQTMAEINGSMDITMTHVKITRRGSGTDSIYTIIPLGPLPLNVLDGVSKVTLNVLEKKPDKPEMPSYEQDAAGDTWPDAADQVPF